MQHTHSSSLLSFLFYSRPSNNSRFFCVQFTTPSVLPSIYTQISSPPSYTSIDVLTYTHTFKHCAPTHTFTRTPKQRALRQSTRLASTHRPHPHFRALSEHTFYFIYKPSHQTTTATCPTLLFLLSPTSSNTSHPPQLSPLHQCTHHHLHPSRPSGNSSPWPMHKTRRWPLSTLINAFHKSTTTSSTHHGTIDTLLASDKNPDPPSHQHPPGDQPPPSRPATPTRPPPSARHWWPTRQSPCRPRPRPDLPRHNRPSASGSATLPTQESLPLPPRPTPQVFRI